MEATGAVPSKQHPVTVVIPTRRGVVLLNRESSSDTARSRPAMPLCPAYRVCRQSNFRRSRSPTLDDDREQQITVLRDLLQSIKGTALRLRQLIDLNERRLRNPDSGIRYCITEQDEESDQQRRPGSGPIIADKISSICALCGVAFRPKDRSEQTRRLAADGDEKMSVFKKMILSGTSFSFETETSSNNPHIHESALGRSPRDGSNNYDVGASARGTRKDLSIERNENNLSKWLFTRRRYSDPTVCQECQDESEQTHYSGTRAMEYADNDCCTLETRKYLCEGNVSKASETVKLIQRSPKIASPTISHIRDASTLTHDMLCPCACGLLVGDGTESEISIESLSTLKEKLVKSKLEELGLRQDSKETSGRINGSITKIRNSKVQKLRSDKSAESGAEVITMQLQEQIEELRRNVQFYKLENAYLRGLVEKCRCPPEKSSGFNTAFEFLRIKYRSNNGIVSALANMFRGSMNIQSITEKLLAPFVGQSSSGDSYTVSLVSGNSSEIAESSGFSMASEDQTVLM